MLVSIGFLAWFNKRGSCLSAIVSVSEQREMHLSRCDATCGHLMTALSLGAAGTNVIAFLNKDSSFLLLATVGGHQLSYHFCLNEHGRKNPYLTLNIRTTLYLARRKPGACKLSSGLR